MIALDTHAWIWFANESRKLSAVARKAIDSEQELLVSAISCWEVSMLVEKKRLTLDRDVLVWLRQALALLGIVLAPRSPYAQPDWAAPFTKIPPTG